MEVFAGDAVGDKQGREFIFAVQTLAIDVDRLKQRHVDLVQNAQDLGGIERLGVNFHQRVPHGGRAHYHHVIV